MAGIKTGTVWCTSCQEWLRPGTFIHSCYDASEKLVVSLVGRGRKRHLAWARGLDITKDKTLCGRGPADLTLDLAAWPLDDLCKECLREWTRARVYSDFP